MALLGICQRVPEAGRRSHKLNSDEMNPQSSASDGYVSFVAHIWVADNGKLIRGTIEDAHTGARLALDLSEILAFLQTSLAHSPRQVGTLQTEGNGDTSESQPGDKSGEGLPDASDEDNHAQGEQSGAEG